MLVLSRKQDQKLSFPGLGITVQILRVKGSTVRLGVDAPLEVRILREELEPAGPHIAPQEHVIRLPQKLRHELRNELNALSISLHLFKQELEAGYAQDAEATFQKLVEHLERVCTNQVLSHAGVSADKPANSTALLVEDQANEREMLAGFLRLHGYEVATAGDGLEAIEYLESHARPSVVLIDMRMPRYDGPSTIRRIRENRAFDGVKIFAISGSTPEESHVDPEEDGLNGWFMKPLNPRSLVDAMAVTIAEAENTAA